MGKLLNNGFRTLKQERKLVSIREGQRKRYCEEDHHQDLALKSIHADHSYAVTSKRFVPDISNIVHEEVLDNDGNNLTPTDDWRIGRRVVELGVIADHLQQSAIDLGLGEHQINGLLSILNIPTVSHCMIDNRIREVGDVIESVADKSMEEWTEKEKEMTRESDGNDNVTVSVDAAWQRRGSGRSYDSLTGKPFYPDLEHFSMISSKTGKVINYKWRSKACRICQRAEISGNIPRVHKCNKNFTGSAKAMEPDMVVDRQMAVRSAAVCPEVIGASGNRGNTAHMRSNNMI
ncbi:unnamed protein product [Mytilus edulis]|uniref:Mutator-like transposase domain-containing protein n=1 Tax=Mytilus edulis TaxID=6550 RepID=A0A8S3RR02_MYTED|nr:unnamed protein product [Mytilus edulis]